MRTVLRTLLLAIAFLAGTALVGWWTVPLLAAAWGVIAWRVPRAGVLAGVAAMVAWGALLVIAARAEAFGALTRALAGVMQAPPASLVALTLIFPALLAWSAARVTAVVTTVLRRRQMAPRNYAIGAAVGEPDGDASSASDRPREVYAAK